MCCPARPAGRRAFGQLRAALDLDPVGGEYPGHAGHGVFSRGPLGPVVHRAGQEDIALTSGRSGTGEMVVRQRAEARGPDGEIPGDAAQASDD
jgi:hypothetical protein